MELIKYNTSVGIYIISQWVDRVPNCNGIVITNVGDTIVTVNELILYPGVPGTNLGDSRTIGGNLGEVYVGKIRVQFANPAGAAPRVEIAQKFYV